MNTPLKMQYLWLVFLFPFIGISQEEIKDDARETKVDLRYREDQFYFGITYNILMDAPAGFTGIGLSGGFHGGFLRDMPINERRNIAVAAGLGFAYNQFGQNLFIGEDSNENSIFRVLDGTVDYSENRFKMATVELPIELRWRTSTPTEYRFWRIYAGARIGYAYWYESSFRQADNNVNQTKIPEFNPIRLAATLSFGYSTFNFFASYSLNPFFEDASTTEGEKIDLRALKVGLIFYIL